MQANRQLLDAMLDQAEQSQTDPLVAVEITPENEITVKNQAGQEVIRLTPIGVTKKNREQTRRRRKMAARSRKINRRR